MNRRQKIIVSITGIFLVLLILVGLTYAYFLTQIQGNDEEKSISVTTAKLELVYSDNTPEVKITGIVPITTDKIKTEGLVKSFTIAKTETSADVNTTIKLNNLNVSENIAVNDLKWALYQGDKPLTTGTFREKINGEIILATNQFINSTTGLDYNLYIWINETGKDQSDMMNGTLTAKIDANGTNDKQTLSSFMLGNNNDNVTTTPPTFSTNSTDRGLFVQSGDVTKSEMGFPVYYYKGSSKNETINTDYVMNNYVKFGKYKTIDGENTIGEDIIWRIVRTNEDGSIRLITENSISSFVQFNTTGYHNYFNEDGTDGNAKVLVEAWYNNNIGNDTALDTKVVESSFCLDDRILYSSNNTIASYNCPSNFKIYSKVALLTAEEAYNSGMPVMIYGDNNNISYIARESGFDWLLDQMDGYGSFFDRYGISYGADMSEDMATAKLRAVINLSPDVIVSGGDGLSADTAYIIK